MIIKAILIMHFVAPMLVLLLFINPAVKDIVVPAYISNDSYDVTKYAFVGITGLLRGLTFKREIQFICEESFQLMHNLVQTRSEQVFTYVKYRVTDNFKRTWYLVFQQATTIMLPVCLVLLATEKGLTWWMSEERVLALAHEALSPRNKTSEFLQVFDIERFREKFEWDKLEKGTYNFSLLDMGQRNIVAEYVGEITKIGIVPHRYYAALIEFAIVWYHFAVMFVTSFALLYYRKFRSG